MSSTSAIALSGMNAAQSQLNASAHNIANLATPNFRRQAVQQTAQPDGGGVSTGLGRAETEGASIETDVLGMLQAKNAFLANLAVFKSAQRNSDSVLKATG